MLICGEVKNALKERRIEESRSLEVKNNYKGVIHSFHIIHIRISSLPVCRPAVLRMAAAAVEESSSLSSDLGSAAITKLLLNCCQFKIVAARVGDNSVVVVTQQDKSLAVVVKFSRLSARQTKLIGRFAYYTV